MQDYLLFIDTETSGKPRRWNAPYSQKDNWPHALQISWLLYTREGVLVRQEDHYISDDDFTIAPSAFQVHGLTAAFLREKGRPRREVLARLAADLETFQPLVLGHFMAFDAHIAGAEFYRSGLADPLPGLPAFCTMQGTRHLVRNPAAHFLRLGELYELLFQKPQRHPHNALADAQATAECFFELIKRGDIDPEKAGPPQLEAVAAPSGRTSGLLAALLSAFVISLILYCLWKTGSPSFVP
ncbi:3'-5' exonuclease [Paraflavisolibacter sp. H34]|uniref:3'-5' exonuclease n=1 Tax=Huijunlia imazamoxiresistens TaxID=3127457 RepID=UPI00301759B0